MLYLKDSYKKEFETAVEDADGNKVVLAGTYFYPNSGGQPCDTGTIFQEDKEFKIMNVKKENGKIIHELDREGVKADGKVRCIIDWERRYKLMRMHTAAHIISAVINKETGAMITGNQLDEEKSRIDFSLDDFKKDLFEKYIEEANLEIKKDHKITTEIISKDEAEKKENLSKLAKGLPVELKEIRIVKIGSIDEQADGGTHVASTKEIGRIKLLSIENKRK